MRWLPSDSLSVDTLVYYGKTDEVQPTTNCRWLEGTSYNGEDSLFGNRILPGEKYPVDAFNDNDNPVREGFIAQSQVYEEACRRSEALEGDYRTTTDFPINYKLDNLMLGLTLEWELGDSMSLKSISSYGDQEKSGNFGNPDNDNSELPLSSRYRPNGSPSDRQHFSQELQLTGTAFNDRLDYTFGLFAMQEDIDDGTDLRSGLPTGTLIFEPTTIMVMNSPSVERATFELENTTYAAFFQGSYHLTDNLEFTAGLRWTSERRQQTVDLDLLDEAAYRKRAFAAIAGTPGLIPLEAAGVGIVTDLDAVMQADIFSKMSAVFPLDAYGQPVYDMISVDELVPELSKKADETWEELTPMLSLAYQLPDSVLDAMNIDTGMVYASYSEGFKSGTFEPVGVDGQATVEPEIVTNYELGFKLDFMESRMRLNGAIFRTDFDDMQLRSVVFDSGDTLRVVLTNASSTRITGGELEWSWLATDELLLLATASYNDYDYLDFKEPQFSSRALFTQSPLPVVDRSSEPFAEVPKLTWSLGVQYTLDTRFGTFIPRLDYSYVDEIFMGLDAGAGQNRDQSTFDDYGLLNARVGWVGPNGRFEGALYATNLTDELYFFGAATVGDSTGVFSTTSAPPRMYGLEFCVNF